MDAGTYSLIGAAALLGGTTRMTISIAVIVLEATGNYQYGLPLMVTLMAARFAGNLFSAGLYDMQIALRQWPILEDKIHKAMASDLRASDVMTSDVIVLQEVEKVGRVLDVLTKTEYSGFPVVFSEAMLRSHPRLGNLAGYIQRKHLATLLAHGKRTFHEGLPDQLLPMSGPEESGASASSGAAAVAAVEANMARFTTAQGTVIHGLDASGAAAPSPASAAPSGSPPVTGRKGSSSSPPDAARPASQPAAGSDAFLALVVAPDSAADDADTAAVGVVQSPPASYPGAAAGAASRAGPQHLGFNGSHPHVAPETDAAAAVPLASGGAAASLAAAGRPPRHGYSRSQGAPSQASSAAPLPMLRGSSFAPSALPLPSRQPAPMLRHQSSSYDPAAAASSASLYYDGSASPAAGAAASGASSTAHGMEDADSNEMALRAAQTGRSTAASRYLKLSRNIVANKSSKGAAARKAGWFSTLPAAASRTGSLRLRRQGSTDADDASAARLPAEESFATAGTAAGFESLHSPLMTGASSASIRRLPSSGTTPVASSPAGSVRGGLRTGSSSSTAGAGAAAARPAMSSIRFLSNLFGGSTVGMAHSVNGPTTAGADDGSRPAASGLRASLLMSPEDGGQGGDSDGPNVFADSAPDFGDGSLTTGADAEAAAAAVAEPQHSAAVYNALYAGEYRYPDEPTLKWADFEALYPRYVAVSSLRISAADREKYIDLRPYMDPTPLCVHVFTPLSRTYKMFRDMALRHLLVVNNCHDVVGVISRQNLTEEELHARHQAVKYGWDEDDAAGDAGQSDPALRLSSLQHLPEALPQQSSSAQLLMERLQQARASAAAAASPATGAGFDAAVTTGTTLASPAAATLARHSRTASAQTQSGGAAATHARPARQPTEHFDLATTVATLSVGGAALDAAFALAAPAPAAAGAAASAATQAQPAPAADTAAASQPPLMALPAGASDTATSPAADSAQATPATPPPVPPFTPAAAPAPAAAASHAAGPSDVSTLARYVDFDDEARYDDDSDDSDGDDGRAGSAPPPLPSTGDDDRDDTRVSLLGGGGSYAAIGDGADE